MFRAIFVVKKTGDFSIKRFGIPPAEGVAGRAETGKPASEGPLDITSLRQTCSRFAYDYGLTRREEEVLALLAQGMTAQQIEASLCVSNSTVKSHTHAVYHKLGIHSRGELAEKVAGMQSSTKG